MNFRPAILSLLTGGFLLTLPLSTSAQEYSLSDTLAKISGEMYTQHISYFIVVDALKEGLVGDGQDMTFRYENGLVTIDDKPLDEPYQSRYSARFRAFSTNGMSPGDKLSHRITSTVSLREILTPTAAVRNMADLTMWGPRSQTSLEEAFLREGLIEKGVPARILFTKDAVSINDVALPADKAARFLAVLQANSNFVAEKDSDALLFIIRK